MKNKKIAALMAVAFLFAGCSAGGNNQSSGQAGGQSSGETASSGYSTTLEDIKEQGKLVIGLDDTFAPMGFRDVDGTLVGFDIDLANAVCEELGVKAEFQPIDWDAKEMALSAGTVDCLWNGVSITPARQEEMAMTDPYLNNKIIVMYRDGITLESKEDLANVQIGIQVSSAALEAVQADPIYDTIQENLTEYLTYDDVILDVQAGRLDCMIIDEVYGSYKNEKMGGVFQTASFDFGDDFYGIAFRKGDTELADAVNEVVTQLIEDKTAAQISQKWFGRDMTVSPSDN